MIQFMLVVFQHVFSRSFGFSNDFSGLGPPVLRKTGTIVFIVVC